MTAPPWLGPFLFVRPQAVNLWCAALPRGRDPSPAGPNYPPGTLVFRVCDGPLPLPDRDPRRTLARFPVEGRMRRRGGGPGAVRAARRQLRLERRGRDRSQRKRGPQRRTEPGSSRMTAPREQGPAGGGRRAYLMLQPWGRGDGPTGCFSGTIRGGGRRAARSAASAPWVASLR